MMTSNTESIDQLKENFRNGLTRPMAFRLNQLNGLTRFLTEHENDIFTALHDDLGKSAIEAYSTEIAIILAEIKLTKKYLSSWIKTRRVRTAFITQPGKSYIYTEPRGLILIISPWNYPLQLSLLPLVGALAAGNCAVIKPSEIAPATSRLIATHLPNYVDQCCLRIIEGGVTETTNLLNQHFDYIFYTGSTLVGRMVMEAAAKQLIPVTLELGGKCPCIVDKDCNINVAAKRIVWSKFTNAGQTCVAPDYVLVHEEVKDALISKIQKSIQEFYGDNPERSTDYGRIINHKHFQRLIKLLDGNDIIIGGQTNEMQRYIAPTVLQNVSLSSPIMQEEIFGPILPIITVNSIVNAIQIINTKPKPLAIYLFSNDEKSKAFVINHTSSGSVCINHAMLQLANPALPFGGIGESGIGAYHGKTSVDTFSHKKSVLFKPFWFDPSIFYPPYKNSFMKLIRWLMA